MISIVYFLLFIFTSPFAHFVLSSISNPFLSMNSAIIMAESSLPLSSLNTGHENHDSNNHLRVASFAAYLNPNEEDFVLKLAESFRKPSLATALTDDESSLVGKTKKVGEGEIRVFDAEKYFKMNIGDDVPTFSHSDSSKYWNEKSEDRVRPSSKYRPGTPSASSDSSWNSSQSALFSSMIQTPSHKDKKAMGSRFFTGFSCRGSCSDGKSVDISQNGSSHTKDFTKKTLQIDQRSMIGYKKEEKFTSSSVNSGVKTKPVIVKPQIDEEKPEEARDSIEVFGSHMLNKGDIAENLERKLSVLTWDAIPQTQNLKSTNSRTSKSYDHDNDSDGSSDLFEIENISVKVPTKPQYTRQQSDSGISSCMTPTTLYAPSEASIEWSVVTASAAEFPALSEYEELKMGGPDLTNKNKAMKGRPSTGLLGCKSDKAVRAAEPAYQSNQKVKSGQELSTLKAEKKVKDFEFFPPTQRAMF